MTDLEMVRLCAEAMGFKVLYPDQAGLPLCIESAIGAGVYDPLKDDAEAMALVKNCWLALEQVFDSESGTWSWRVCKRDSYGDKYTTTKLGFSGEVLNRAIVECVAKMQKAKQ